MATIYNPTPLQSVTPSLGKLYSGSPRDFGPRVGFNWDPFKQGRTSIRGGFGIFFNQIWDDTFFTGGTAQYPFVFSVTGLANVMTLPFSQSILNAQLQNPSVSGARQTFAGSTQAQPDTPTKYGFNLEIQHELPGHLTMLIGYVGALQRHQGRSTAWQEYAPAGTETPGQVPMFNGAPVIYGVYANGVQTGTVQAPINPNCTVAGMQSCLFWVFGQTAATPATQPISTITPTNNANNTGNTKPAASFTGYSPYLMFDANHNPVNANPYATDCSPTQTANCFNNNSYGNSVTDIIFDANSSYHGLQAALERRMSPGLFAIGDRGGGASNGGGNAWTPTANHRGSYSRCAFQGTNSANLSFTYDVPFGKSSNSAFIKAALAGWQLSSLTQIQSGFPFDVREGANTTGAAPSGNGNAHPDLVAGCTAQNIVNKGNVTAYINTSCFAAPTPGYLGNMGPLILTGPATWSTDLSLKKKITIRESQTLQLTADMFNAFNRTNLAPPDATTAFVLQSGALVPNPTAGQITRTVILSRQFQIGARFQF
jgi:hypothetical protein